MPDNQSVSSTPYDVATDKVTYSGDADRNVQLSRIVAVTGAEGSKTVVENMPESLGQKAMAASFPVVLPSDQTVPVAGNVASGSADSGNPVKVGGVAIDFESMPADVTVGDRVDAAYTPKGIAGVALFHPTLSTPLETLPVSVSSGDVSVSVIGAGDNNIGNVDVASSVLPAGAATEAELDAQTALLTTIDADTSRIPALGQATMANSQPVAIASNQGAVPVSGTVAVTGVATAAEQATQTASLGVMDDWDETDRAKVNIVAGQAGISAGAGAVAANTPRVTSASDDPAVTALAAIQTAAQIMDDWDESDRAKVNPIAGQAGVQGGAGAVTALTQRVVLATDTTVPNVSGDIAHDGADSGNPLKIGGKAANAFPTAVANNDRANALTDLFGRQLVSHIDPAMQIWKSYNDTSSRGAGSAQVVWDPTSGKRICVTYLQISAYGTTAGRIFLFFGDDADLTYSAGTDQPLFVGSFAPSATANPGSITPLAHPVFCVTADRRLHYQNSAAISLDIVLYGYEF